MARTPIKLDQIELPPNDNNTYGIRNGQWVLIDSTGNLQPNPPTTFTASNIEADSFILNWDTATDN